MRWNATASELWVSSAIGPWSLHPLIVCPQYALLLTCRASFQYLRVCARFPRFFSKSAYVLACRASFQNPRVCARFPRFFSKSAHVFSCRSSVQNLRKCSLVALLFNIPAPAHLLHFCLISTLELTYSTFNQSCESRRQTFSSISGPRFS